MSENPSVDSAALRREARRRRILENSEERLRSITGRPVSEPSEARQESRNRFLYDFQNPQVNDMFGEPGERLPPELDVEEDFLTYKAHVNGDKDDAVIISPATLANGFERIRMKNMIRKRLHLIILSLIIQLFYIFKLEYLFFNNIFIPFIIVKLMEFWLMHEPFKMDNQEQFALMSAMFTGSTPRRMLRAYYIIAPIASDFCLYIFVIVASDKLFRVAILPYLPNWKN